MYSADGEPATVGTRGYHRQLQETVDDIQQGDGLKLVAKGIHDARTVGRFEAVKIIDRRSIRLFSRSAPTPEPFAELWAENDGETATGGFQTESGEYTADIILEPESTELLTLFWNGLLDFESQFKNRTFGDQHPTDVLIFNNETTEYITIIYHADITETLEEIYRLYLSEYDAETDTGDRFKAELLYPEYRQFRSNLPENVPSQTVLESEENPFPRTSRVSGPPLDRLESSTQNTGSESPTSTNGSTNSESPSSDTVASDEATSDAEQPDEEPASTDDQPPWAEELEIELSHSWTKESAVTMADYGGRPELTETIRNSVIVPFRDRPEQARELGVPVPSLLLYGPPGTGKTYLAKALAGEIGYPYVTLSGGDMLSRYINASTENVNELFAEARALAEHAGGALVFIDEIDSVLKARNSSNQHAEDQKVVNEFLTQIEEIGEENILFMGATNVHEELDSAALSRFDKELFVDLPEEQTRREIIATHLSDRAHSVTDNEIADLAASTDGYSARDLTKIVTDAARRTLVDPDSDEISFGACQDALADFAN
jgi:transitional endoplasmic reticulum ATPase